VYEEIAESKESLKKVVSKRSRQVGYIPKKTLYQLHNLYIVIKSYRATRKEELSVCTRDFLELINKKGNWLYVHCINSGGKGLVRTDHVVKFKPLDESE
jgi:hypothetical protein